MEPPVPPTQGELHCSKEIHDHRALTRHTAVNRLFPKLRLTCTDKDGNTKSDLQIFRAAWNFIVGLQQQKYFMHENQLPKFVRLLGYAQAGVSITQASQARIEDMLQNPGASCRIYGWTVPEDCPVDAPPSQEEQSFVNSILREGAKNNMGLISITAAHRIFLRSHLHPRTLASIWIKVINRGQKLLGRLELVKASRLIGCAQRGQLCQSEIPVEPPALDSRLTKRMVTKYSAIFDKSLPQPGYMPWHLWLEIGGRTRYSPSRAYLEYIDSLVIDRFGSLSRGEFIVAFYLLHKLWSRRAKCHAPRENKPRLPEWLMYEITRIDTSLGGRAVARMPPPSPPPPPLLPPPPPYCANQTEAPPPYLESPTKAPPPY